ncbi:MAG: hypothetical protein MUC87_04785 [Bacteroidia bacterium]|nr:hypothetical protein [Bacteroidia bacterium]
MKKLTLLALSGIALLALGSCSSMKMSKSAPEQDDIYYSLKDAKADRKAAAKAKEEEEQRMREAAEARELAEAQRVARSKPGSDYYDEPFDYDDYYDYEYAARLRRFGPGAVNGCGYYDPFFTNSYFYTGNPYNYGTSIYNGYSFWGPQYQMYNYNPSSFWYWNQGWGWGIGSGLTYMSPVFMNPGMGFTPGWGNPYWYNPWGPTYGVGWGNQWGSWYDPWQTWGYYDPFWNGFGPGCNMGGMNGMAMNNWYFNSFDENSAYYGPRRSTSGVGGRGEAVQNGTLGERFMNEVAAENGVEEMNRSEVNNALNSRPALPPVYGVNTSGTTPAPPASTEGRSTTSSPVGTVPAPPATTDRVNTPVATDRNTAAPGGTPPLPPRPRVNDSQPSVSPNAVPSSSGNTPRSNSDSPRSRPRVESSPSSSPSPSFESSPRSSGSSSSGSSSSPRSSGSSGTSSRPR